MKNQMGQCGCGHMGAMRAAQPTNKNQVPEMIEKNCGKKTCTCEGHNERAAEVKPLTQEPPDGKVGEG